MEDCVTTFPASPEGIRPAKKRKTASACQRCRAKKIKCDGEHPICGACAKILPGEGQCAYDTGREVIESHRKVIQDLENRIRTLESSIGAERQTGDAPVVGGLASTVPHNASFPVRSASDHLHHGPRAAISDFTTSALSRHGGRTNLDSTHVLGDNATRHGNQSPWTDLLLDGFVATETSSAPGVSNQRRLRSSPEAAQDSDPSPCTGNHVAHESLLPISPSNYSAGVDGMGAVDGAPDNSASVYYGRSSTASFMREVRKMVEAKIGSPVAPHPVGPLSHQLFGSAQFKTPLAVSITGDYVLPPRKTADYLLGIYWDRVHCFYPFLYRNHFMQTYMSLWTGEESASAPSFHCVLNTAFALACQLNPEIAAESREASSEVFFSRAKTLLQFHILEGGSFEFVQALLLMSQYLQSTNSPSRCWIVAGLAIRIAQGLGLHQDEVIMAMPSQRDREMAKRVWHGCILMDRILALTLGRPMMILKSPATSIMLPEAIDDEYLAIEPGKEHVQPRQRPSKIEFFNWTLKLYDILAEILLHFYASGLDEFRSTHPDEQNPKLDEDIVPVLRLDRSLTSFWNALPAMLKQSDSGNVDAVFVRQSVILKARFLHLRTLLFRPMLARLSFAENASQKDRIPAQSQLRQTMLFRSSVLCVTAAQDLIELIHHDLSYDDGDSPLPAWWYNVFYVYTATTVLIAARICPMLLNEVTEAALSRSWDHAIAILKAFRPQSSSARRCLVALEVLNEKITLQRQTGPEQLPTGAVLSMQNSGVAAFHGGVSEQENEAVPLDDIGLIGTTDMRWLNSVPSDLDPLSLWNL